MNAPELFKGAFDSAEAPKKNDDTKPKKPTDSVILTSGADLTPEPIRWLWDGWLACGKLHLLAGAPGQGKTTIALSMAATVTTGGKWPDGSFCPTGNVVVWSGEDDPADTLLPRLLASGADKSRVYFICGARINDEVQSFDPARDMLALMESCEAIGNVRLIIVDPIVSAVTGDSHKNTETRRALQPLVDLAAHMDAALVGITHFSKGGQGGDPAQRVVGSVAFTAVARVVMVAAKVKSDGEDGDDRRIFARAKSNIGPDNGGFEYSLEQDEPLPGIHASFIAWGNAVDGAAHELLTDPTDDRETESEAERQNKFERVRCALYEWLRPFRSTAELKEIAKAEGISWRTVEYAKAAELKAGNHISVKKMNGKWGWHWDDYEKKYGSSEADSSPQEAPQ